jgi:hypothetical protein
MQEPDQTPRSRPSYPLASEQVAAGLELMWFPNSKSLVSFLQMLERFDYPQNSTPTSQQWFE